MGSSKQEELSPFALDALVYSIAARAQVQWRLVLKMVSSNGERRPPVFTDPITANLVNHQFSWSYLCNMPVNDHNWEEKRWVEAFDMAAEVHKDLIQIEPPKGGGVLKQLKSVPDTKKETTVQVPIDKITAYKEMLQAKEPENLDDTNQRINIRLDLLRKQAKEFEKQ